MKGQECVTAGEGVERQDCASVTGRLSGSARARACVRACVTSLPLLPWQFLYLSEPAFVDFVNVLVLDLFSA